MFAFNEIKAVRFREKIKAGFGKALQIAKWFKIALGTVDFANAFPKPSKSALPNKIQIVRIWWKLFTSEKI